MDLGKFRRKRTFCEYVILALGGLNLNQLLDDIHG